MEIKTFLSSQGKKLLHSLASKHSRELAFMAVSFLNKFDAWSAGPTGPAASGGQLPRHRYGAERFSEPGLGPISQHFSFGGAGVADDQEILDRVLGGDQAAFAELVDRYKRMVYNLVDRMFSGEDMAQDLAQEVFVRVYRALPRFRGEAKLSTWIYRIAYRVCLAELERPHRRQSYLRLDGSDTEEPRAVSSTDRNFAAVDLQQYLEHLLARLSPPHRMVLTLYYLQEHTYEEIAAITELPIGTVKTYLHRSKKYLRKAIENEAQ